MRLPSLIVEKNQVWRLLAPSILHVGFRHWIVTTAFILVLGTALEQIMKPLKFFCFYLIIVIGSNLFGACVSGEASVGSDPVVVALALCLIIMMALEWPSLEQPGF